MTSFELMAMIGLVVMIALAGLVAYKLDEDIHELDEPIDIERRQIDQPIDFIDRRKNEN